MRRKNIYKYRMSVSVNEKFGCLLYSTDLQSIHEEEQLRRRAGRTSSRYNNKNNNKNKAVTRVIKPVDFFMYNEIVISNALTENDEIYNGGSAFECHLYSFSSFVPLKTKKEIKEMNQTKEEIIRSENDDSTNKITYGAFNYLFKDKPLFAYFGEAKTRTDFCRRTITAYKRVLDNLSYLKKNEAVHLGISLETILVKNDGATLLDGVKYVRFIGGLKESVIKMTIGDKENGLSPLFLPIELSLFVYMVDNDVHALSSNNVRVVIGEHMFHSEIVKRLSEAFQTDYVNNCEAVLCKYVNVPKNEVLCDILKQSRTWGMYSVSVVFLTMMMKVQVFYNNLLKTGIFNKWFKLLLMNTHPNPDRRKTVEENMSIFSKLTCVKSFAEFTPFLNEVSDENLFKIGECLVKPERAI